jgi:hypothetical protein
MAGSPRLSVIRVQAMGFYVIPRCAPAASCLNRHRCIAGGLPAVGQVNDGAEHAIHDSRHPNVVERLRGISGIVVIRIAHERGVRDHEGRIAERPIIKVIGAVRSDSDGIRVTDGLHPRGAPETFLGFAHEIAVGPAADKGDESAVARVEKVEPRVLTGCEGL